MDDVIMAYAICTGNWWRREIDAIQKVLDKRQELPRGHWYFFCDGRTVTVKHESWKSELPFDTIENMMDWLRNWNGDGMHVGTIYNE